MEGPAAAAKRCCSVEDKPGGRAQWQKGMMPDLANCVGGGAGRHLTQHTRKQFF